MVKNFQFKFVLCSVALSLVSFHAKAAIDLKVGSIAPHFITVASDGKTYNLKTLAKKGPIFLHFIDKECPFNEKTISYFKSLTDNYKKGFTYLGVINSDQKGYLDWKKQHKVSFNALLDPKESLIEKYQVERSPWIVYIGKDFKIKKIWRGYSMSSLEEINSLMAATSRTPKKKLNFSGAPKALRAGCTYSWYSKK